jgi:ribonuclease Z
MLPCKVVVAVLVAIFAAFAGFFFSEHSDPLIEALIPALMANSLSRQEARRIEAQGWLTDGELHLVTCGTGTPAPDHSRASQCMAVIAGGRFFLFDTGDGSAENVATMSLPVRNMSAIFFTHYHSDHIADLGEMTIVRWTRGQRQPLPVYGPPGVKQVVGGFQAAYALDATYRTAHHTEEYMPPAGALYEVHEINVCEDCPKASDRAAVVYDEDGLTVTAFQVHHEPVKPAYGYKVTYAGRSVVISGDTTQCEEVEIAAAGADVLVHDAINHKLVEALANAQYPSQARLKKLLNDTLDYHANPVQALQTASKANVQLLLLTHMLPPSQGSSIFKRFSQLGWAGWNDAPSWGGRWMQADDGMHFSMPPAPSAQIKQGKSLL